MQDRARRGEARARHSWATALHSTASAILLLAFSIGGCSGDPRSTSAAEATPGATSTPAGSLATPGARPTPTASASSAPMQQVSIAVGDDERLVDVFAPADAGPDPTALIVMLHANGETPYLMEQESEIGVVAARERVIVALPPARDHRWNARICCGDPVVPSPDVAYVKGLITRLIADFPIDRDRVFVAGFSMGAALSERMACEAADLVTAVAIDAGAPWSDVCEPLRPVSILVMHGTADSTFPISGAVQIVNRWRERDACQGQPAIAELGDGVTSETNEQCRSGTAVQFFSYRGAAHRWFEKPDATDLLWTFFESRTRK